MQISFIPKTKLGKYSVVSIMVGIVLIVSVMLIDMNVDVPMEYEGFFGNIPLALMALGALASATISTVTGLIAVLKKQESAILVYAAIGIGALAIYFGIAQMVGELTHTF